MEIDCVLGILESFAPLSLQSEWDNSGLLIGDRHNELTGVVLCLDVSEETVKYAVKNGCNLIISHHPIIFGGVKSITSDSVLGRIINLAITHNISVFSAHTNVDICSGGLNDALCEKFGIVNTQILYPDGLGRVGTLESFQTLESVFSRAKEVFGKNINVVGDLSKNINKVAVTCGSGGRDESLAEILKADGVDLFISSEFKHSVLLELAGEGIAVIEATHYASEKHFCELVYIWLNNHLENVRIETFEYDVFRN